MDTTHSVPDFIAHDSPDGPVFCFRQGRLERAANWFRTHFPGEPFYAVKANPAAHVLHTLWACGITSFDVASIAEVEHVATTLPGARLAFLHPVKSRRAIARAYDEFGVRRFVLDSQAELDKILKATGRACDLTLLVRVGVSNDGATLPLTGKFGATALEAPELLRAARTAAPSLGVSFHVGSQAMNPTAWHTAMADLSRLIVQAGVTVDIVDVGGGFPAVYDAADTADLSAYMHMIEAAFADMYVLQSAELWCEPGRALVAEAESLLVGIDGAKPGALYLNDGSFGALYDCVHERWSFPLRAISACGEVIDRPPAPYTLYGPTCDSADRFPDTVWLPDGLGEGDWLEFGNIGAYGRAMASRFNGFGGYRTIAAGDGPWPSLYGASDGAAATATSRTVP